MGYQVSFYVLEDKRFVDVKEETAKGELEVAVTVASPVRD